MKVEELLQMDQDDREILIDWAEAQAEQLEITVDYFIEEWM